MRIKINIHEIALSRGIQNPHQLQTRAKLTPTNASHLFNNRIRLISMETLGKLCEALNCGPNDLFSFAETQAKRK